MLPTNFTNLLMALQYRKTYQRALLMAKQKFNLRQNNIEDLTPFKTLEMYRAVIKKFYMSRTDITEGSWFENQLRIFLWLLIGYLFIHRKSIQQMNNEDWSYFSPIFHNRPQISFEYQGLCLIPQSRSGKWSLAEIDIFRSIMKQKQFTNKWNSIARELFIRSERTFYRSPKQCRERWLNYLDPNKKKTGWDKNEDLLLLKTINQFRNRWSVAVKILNNTRTQHSVKNRYKSLVVNEMKVRKLVQREATIKLIERLQKQLGQNDNEQIHLGLVMNTKVSLHETLSSLDPQIYESQHQAVSKNINFSPFNLYTNYQQSDKVSPFIAELNNQQNDFFMSNEEIDDFLFHDLQKDNKIMIKPQYQEDHNMEQNQFGPQEKINYFSEEYHSCFP